MNQKWLKNLMLFYPHLQIDCLSCRFPLHFRMLAGNNHNMTIRSISIHLFFSFPEFPLHLMCNLSYRSRVKGSCKMRINQVLRFCKSGCFLEKTLTSCERFSVSDLYCRFQRLPEFYLRFSASYYYLLVSFSAQSICPESLSLYHS